VRRPELFAPVRDCQQGATLWIVTMGRIGAQMYLHCRRAQRSQASFTSSRDSAAEPTDFMNSRAMIPRRGQHQRHHLHHQQHVRAVFPWQRSAPSWRFYAACVELQQCALRTRAPACLILRAGGAFVRIYKGLWPGASTRAVEFNQRRAQLQPRRACWMTCQWAFDYKQRKHIALTTVITIVIAVAFVIVDAIAINLRRVGAMLIQILC